MKTQKAYAIVNKKGKIVSWSRSSILGLAIIVNKKYAQEHIKDEYWKEKK